MLHRIERFDLLVASCAMPDVFVAHQRERIKELRAQLRSSRQHVLTWLGDYTRSLRGRRFLLTDDGIRIAREVPERIERYTVIKERLAEAERDLKDAQKRVAQRRR